MTETNEIRSELAEIFIQVQKTTSCHQKCLQALNRMYKENSDVLFEYLKSILCSLLQEDYKIGNFYVSRCIDFLCAFLTSIQPSVDESFVESELLSKTIDFLLSVQDLKSEIIRFRSCEILNILFNHMVGTEVSDDLCNEIQNAMLERLKDDKPAVRLQAVLVLHRLQNPSDLNDPIIKEYILHLSSDPNNKVRKTCIEKVAPRRDVIPHLIDRTRDVDVQVRLAAFSKLSKLPKHLKIEERHRVIRNGFLDGAEIVKNFVEQKLVASWLQIYKNKYFDLLKALRIDADDSDIEQTRCIVNYILSSLFRCQTQKELLEALPKNNECLIPFEDLNWETVAFWRFLVEQLRENDCNEHLLSEVIPELTKFSNYICQYCKSLPKDMNKLEVMQHNYILRELFTITKGYDFSDTATQKALKDLVRYILMENDHLTGNTIEIIISNLSNLFPKILQQIRFTCEIISELMNPMPSAEEIEEENKKQVKIAELKVKLYTLMDDQSICIKQENYLKAAELKNEIDFVQQSVKALEETKIKTDDDENKTTDPRCLAKCLDIITALLLLPNLKALTNELRTLKDDMVQDLIIHPLYTLRIKALKCYSLCCLMDRETAKTGIHIFCASILLYHGGGECDIQTLVIAIKTVADLIVLYGSKLVVVPEDQGPSDSANEQQLTIFAGGSSLTDLIQALVDLMDDEEAVVHEWAGRALCNLILSGRIYSSSLISRMILKWCNPASDATETEKLKQCIGFMLERLPSLPEAAEILEKAFMPTIKMLVRAPTSSPLADVDIDSVIKFMVQLSYSVEDSSIHSNLAVSLCKELINKPTSKGIVYFSKALLLLSLPPDDTMLVDQLLELCDVIRDKIGFKQVLNNITKFVTSLTKIKSLKEDTPPLAKEAGGE